MLRIKHFLFTNVSQFTTVTLATVRFRTLSVILKQNFQKRLISAEGFTTRLGLLSQRSRLGLLSQR